MRLFYSALLIAVLPIALGACGQMGSLYMPTAETEAETPATTEPVELPAPTPPTEEN